MRARDPRLIGAMMIGHDDQGRPIVRLIDGTEHVIERDDPPKPVRFKSGLVEARRRRRPR